ncbi:hypothetical protein B0H13DRAFT_1886680 [Mycena leptocephala]|nr:hypothetical protein B0H13DRAFT_1886680 [Mycena leptocephala]
MAPNFPRKIWHPARAQHVQRVSPPRSAHLPSLRRPVHRPSTWRARINPWASWFLSNSAVPTHKNTTAHTQPLHLPPLFLSAIHGHPVSLDRRVPRTGLGSLYQKNGNGTRAVPSSATSPISEGGKNGTGHLSNETASMCDCDKPKFAPSVSGPHDLRVQSNYEELNSYFDHSVLARV